MRSRRDLAWAAALAALVVVCFSDLLLFGRVLFFRDIVRLFVPARAILRDALASGELPLWNPRWAAGQPLAANPVYEAFYPLQFLTLVRDPAYGYGLQITLQLAIAALGMFFFLRSLDLHPPAAALGSVSFALGGVMLSLTNLPTSHASLVWFPWLALFGRRLLRHPTARDFALTSLTLGVILLAGEQAMILQAGALLAAYALTCDRRARSLALVAGVMGAALLVAAAQIAPALDFVRDSGRNTPLPPQVAMTWSFPPSRLLELAFPPPWPQPKLTWLISIYFGLFGGVLALTGFIRRVRGSVLIATIAVAGFVLSFGGSLFYLPLYRYIRYPEKWLTAPVFVLTVLAAIAADRLTTDDALARTATIVASVAAVAALALLAMHRGTLLTAGLACALVILLALRGRVAPPLWVALLAVFVLVDLCSHLGDLAPTQPADFYAPPPVASALGPNASAVRIFNEADEAAKSGVGRTPGQWFVANHDAMLPEMQSTWGYQGVLENDVAITNLKRTAAFQSAFQAMKLAGRRDRVALLLAMGGTTHVIAPAADPKSLQPQLFTLANPRYAFAQQIIQAPGAQLMQRLLSPEPLPQHVAFVDDAPFTPAPGRVLRVHETMNTIDLDVEAAGDKAALLLAVTPDKHWHATIDGRDAPLRIANIAFQMLVIPRGAHHVELRYRNPLVVASLGVSIVSALALLAVALRSRARRQP